MSKTPSRGDVLQKDQRRRMARSALRADGAAAKAEIAPPVLISRWKARQRRRADAAITKGKTVVRQNALLLGAVATGVALFAARKPIMKAVNKIKERNSTI